MSIKSIISTFKFDVQFGARMEITGVIVVSELSIEDSWLVWLWLRIRLTGWSSTWILYRNVTVPLRLFWGQGFTCCSRWVHGWSVGHLNGEPDDNTRDTASSSAVPLPLHHYRTDECALPLVVLVLHMTQSSGCWQHLLCPHPAFPFKIPTNNTYSPSSSYLGNLSYALLAQRLSCMDIYIWIYCYVNLVVMVIMVMHGY